MKKVLLITLVGTLLLSPIFSTSLAEVKRAGGISFSGVIENVHEDLRFIVINEARVFISSSTQIMDEYKNVLTAKDLKPRLYVSVEASRSQNGFLAKKIIVNKRKSE